MTASNASSCYLHEPDVSRSEHLGAISLRIKKSPCYAWCNCTKIMARCDDGLCSKRRAYFNSHQSAYVLLNLHIYSH